MFPPIYAELKADTATRGRDPKNPIDRHPGRWSSGQADEPLLMIYAGAQHAFPTAARIAALATSGSGLAAILRAGARRQSPRIEIELRPGREVRRFRIRGFSASLVGDILRAVEPFDGPGADA